MVYRRALCHPQILAARAPKLVVGYHVGVGKHIVYPAVTGRSLRQDFGGATPFAPHHPTFQPCALSSPQFSSTLELVELFSLAVWYTPNEASWILYSRSSLW
jgi:hypothetical protein